MPENDSTTVSLNHFAVYSWDPAYWDLPEAERAEVRQGWREALGEVGEATYFYETFPQNVMGDLLVWSAQRIENPAMPGAFFRDYARALDPFRAYVRMVDVFWGFTRGSEYSRAKSTQEIDPFGERTAPYIVMYPFTKTAEWYLTEREGRQEMMNEHMRIGKQYREITQLLLYSVGLQDQEFVVVYETDDLALFSKLVADLRVTRARAYTERDVPVYVGIRTEP